jgi:hypothetical protein
MTLPPAADAPIEPRTQWGRIVLIALAILAAIALIAGYGIWAVMSPWLRPVSALPAADNASGAISGIQTSIGYAPPVGAKLIWSHNESGWGNDSTREWILFLPTGIATKADLIKGVGHEGTEFGPEDRRAADFIAGYLTLRSIGTPIWSYNSGQWVINPKERAEIDIVETEQGGCIYAKQRTTR